MIQPTLFGLCGTSFVFEYLFVFEYVLRPTHRHSYGVARRLAGNVRTHEQNHRSDMVKQEM